MDIHLRFPMEFHIFVISGVLQFALNPPHPVAHVAHRALAGAGARGRLPADRQGVGGALRGVRVVSLDHGEVHVVGPYPDDDRARACSGGGVLGVLINTYNYCLNIILYNIIWYHVIPILTLQNNLEILLTTHPKQ